MGEQTLRAMTMGALAPIMQGVPPQARQEVEHRCSNKSSLLGAVPAMVRHVLNFRNGPEHFAILRQRVEVVVPNIELLTYSVLDKGGQEYKRKPQAETR